MYELSWASCVCFCVHRFSIMSDLLHVFMKKNLCISLFQSKILISFVIPWMIPAQSFTFAGAWVEKKSPEIFLKKFILQYLRMQQCFSNSNSKLRCGLRVMPITFDCKRCFLVNIWAFDNLRFYSNHAVSLLFLCLWKSGCLIGNLNLLETNYWRYVSS